MDENSLALSQDAIDALLTSGQPQEDGGPAADGVESVSPAALSPATEAEPENTPTVHLAQPAAEADAHVDHAAPDLSFPTPAPVTVNAPPPPGATPPPGVIHAQHPTATGPVDEARSTAIAEGVVESALSPLQDSFSALSGRIKALEAALKKIEALEKEVARLKAQKLHGEALTIEAARPLAERVVKLEKAAKSSPAFNLYEKFTCASCESQGAAQVRTRCGECGKEGWFGRSKAA